MAPLRLLTLGELRLTAPDGDLLRGQRKLLVLLAYLALKSPRPVTRGELVVLLWGERPDARARQSLRQALVQLRKVCGDALRVDGEQVWVAEGAVEVDLHRFEEALAEGRHADAVEYWGGDLFTGAEDAGGEAFDEWLEVERVRLRRLAAGAFEALVQGAMGRGDWRDAIELAARWVERLPLDERAYLSWIRALQLAGRTTEAAARYAELVARLRVEFGRGPSPEASRLGEELERAGEESAREADGSESLQPSALVGRGDAFGELAAALGAVGAGEGAVVVVAGEVGYGKTRLCEEFLHWAAAESPTPFILRSRAYEGEREHRHATLRDLLVPLGGAPGLGGAPDVVLARLATVAPSILERFRTFQAPATTPSDATLAIDLARVLGDVAAEVPVVVFVDDFPAADPSTRSILLGLARRPPAGVLVLLAGEVAELEADAGLVEIREEPDCRWLELGALGRAEVEALVASMLELDDADRGRLTERLHAECAGHPYLTIALVDALVDEGRIVRDARGRWRLGANALRGDLPLPAELRGAVRLWLDRLSSDARLVVEATAVLAGPASPSLIAEIAGLPLERFAVAADELFVRRILHEARVADGAPDGSTPDAGGIAFTHEILRRVIHDLLNPARREALQGAAEAALDRMAAEPPRRRRAFPALPATPAVRAILAAAIVVVAGLVAFLTLGSGTRGTPPSDGMVAVLPFSVRGAPEYEYLSEGLVDLLSASFDGAGELRSVNPHAVLGAMRGERAGVLDLASGGTLARRLGAGLFVLGSVVEAGGGLRVQAGLYDLDGEARTLVEATADDESGLFQLVDELALKLLAGAHDRPGERFTRLAALTTHSVAALKSYLAGESAFREGRYDLAVDAFAHAASLDTAFALAYYRLAIASEWHSLASPGEIERAVARAVRYADRLPARDRRFLEAFAAYQRGRSIEAEAWFRAILAGDPGDVQAWFGLAEILFHARSRSGRPRALDDARVAFERAVALDPDHEEALFHLVRVYAREGRLAALDSTMDRLEPVLRRGGAVASAARALHAVVRGDLDAERRVAAELAEAPPIFAFVPVVFAAVYGRDLDAATRLARPLTEPHRPPPVRGASHALLAELELARGDWEAARAELDRAEALHPRLALQYRALLALAPGAVVSDDEVAALLRRLEVSGSPEAAEELAVVRELAGAVVLAEDGGGREVPFLTFHPGLEGAIRTYLIGLLHARLGHSADALRAAAELEGSAWTDEAANQAATARVVTGLAAGIRATVARAEGRSAEALGYLEAIEFETWHQWAMTSPIMALSRERFLLAELLSETGRGEEAEWWYSALEASTPHDLVYAGGK